MVSAGDYVYILEAIAYTETDNEAGAKTLSTDTNYVYADLLDAQRDASVRNTAIIAAVGKLAEKNRAINTSRETQHKEDIKTYRLKRAYGYRAEPEPISPVPEPTDPAVLLRTLSGTGEHSLLVVRKIKLS